MKRFATVGTQQTCAATEARRQRARRNSLARGARDLGALLSGLALVVGCATPLHAIPVEPGVDFAAHVSHRGLVVDVMSGASQAVLAPAGWQCLTGGPRFLLQAHGKTIAALWFPDPGHITVRKTADPHSPVVGRIAARWREGAIQLIVKPADGSAFKTGVFKRTDGRLSTAALSWQARTVLDVRGTYRADVRDAQGRPAGWLQARISPYGPARRIYDGVLPAALDGPLGAAAVAVLNSDVTYIENHATDVYIGS